MQLRLVVLALSFLEIKVFLFYLRGVGAKIAFASFALVTLSTMTAVYSIDKGRLDLVALAVQVVLFLIILAVARYNSDRLEFVSNKSRLLLFPKGWKQKFGVFGINTFYFLLFFTPAYFALFGDRTVGLVQFPVLLFGWLVGAIGLIGVLNALLALLD